jgi:CRISPR-associated protein Csy2
MTGYKAITELFAAGEIDGARDAETDVRFVEAVHSIGEWQSVHRLKTLELWSSSVWKYHYDEEGWYLCRQGIGA